MQQLNKPQNMWILNIHQMSLGTYSKKYSVMPACYRRVSIHENNKDRKSELEINFYLMISKLKLLKMIAAAKFKLSLNVYLRNWVESTNVHSIQK
jgi:hypothetical protein